MQSVFNTKFNISDPVINYLISAAKGLSTNVRKWFGIRVLFSYPSLKNLFFPHKIMKSIALLVLLFDYNVSRIKNTK